MAFKLRVLSASFLLISLLIYHGSSAQSCNHTLMGPSGTIASTSAEAYSCPNHTHQWHIQVDQGRKISFILNSIDLPCSDGKIYIWDYHNWLKEWITKCGHATPDPIISFTNEIVINFSPTTNSNIHGFNGNYYSTTTGCGANLNEPSGAFTSPGYPSNYTNKANCQWKITVDQGRRITLKFIAFYVEKLNDICYDKVVVYNGTTSQSGQLGEFCGSEIPASLKSTGNSMSVNFKSDLTARHKGFLAVYNTTVVSCEQLQPPSNGQLNPNSHSVNYQSVVHYTCNSGFNLVGDAWRICQGDGTLTGLQPSCLSTTTTDKDDSTTQTSNESGMPSIHSDIIIYLSVLGTIILMVLLVIAFMCSRNSHNLSSGTENQVRIHENRHQTQATANDASDYLEPRILEGAVGGVHLASSSEIQVHTHLEVVDDNMARCDEPDSFEHTYSEVSEAMETPIDEDSAQYSYAYTAPRGIIMNRPN